MACGVSALRSPPEPLIVAPVLRFLSVTTSLRAVNMRAHPTLRRSTLTTTEPPRATLVSLIASGFTAVYAIRLFNRVGFGRLDNSRANWVSTRWGERAPAILLTAMVVAFGIWPTALTGWSESETNALALRSQPFLLSQGPTLSPLAAVGSPANALASVSLAGPSPASDPAAAPEVLPA